MSERTSNRGLSRYQRSRAYPPLPLHSDDTEYLDSQDARSLTDSIGTDDVADSSTIDPRSGPGTALDMFEQRAQGFDDIANKHLHASETALMIKKFEKQNDIPFSRTYVFGHAQRDFLPDTVEPIVGLVFLPGADMPEVNRWEQNEMVDKIPNQRDSLWRVNTAATLLSVISVGKDLSIVKHDVTPKVVESAVAGYRKDHPKPENRQSKGELKLFRKDAVTVTSNHVGLYRELTGRRLDLMATLVEVNVTSLFELMYDYRWIIQNSGHRMGFQQTKDLLDRMIEAARRFCQNSPILFRMSTRSCIIDAVNIQYGVDGERGFETHTTSKGIQEIIMMSASYFNSLDPSAPGMDESTQRIIRPRFLQMLTLLLSLLNGDDIKSMAKFLERTYGIRPARVDLELLFCKVIPLTSINPTVFLKALIPAIEDIEPCEVVIRDECPQDDYKRCWDILLTSLARKGYLLPGGLDDLGRPRMSWIMKWPTEGINSSKVFGRLQYHGDAVSTFNEIPPGRFGYSPGVTELTVVLTNDETYTIHPQDYQRVSTLTPGLYGATRCDNGDSHELEVTQFVINFAINDAIRVLNDAIGRFNRNAGPRPGPKMGGVLRKRTKEPLLFPEIPVAPRLSRNEAWLQGNLLAVAYKLDGRNVPKAGALRHMNDHYTRVVTLFRHLCESAGRAVAFYEPYIGSINRFLAMDREEHKKEKARHSLSASPIARAFNPDDPEVSTSPIWYSYWVAMRPHPHLGQEFLHIGAKIDLVKSVHWRRPGQQAELTLAQIPTTFFVAPLQPVREDQQEEEVRIGDLALLVGRYIIIAAPHGDDFSYPCVMMNWLEIQDAITTEVSRRGRNMRGPEELPVTAFI